MKEPLLAFTNKGIYCAAADVYLDPWKPVDKALITHGHSDHSRWGHGQYITHHRNVPIIRHRLGAIQVKGVEWGESLRIRGVKFQFFPAGHIVGSSQIRVEHQGEVWVFSGDYKTENDGLCQAFEPVPCHTFITECTFGLPVFRWRPQNEVVSDINRWWTENKAEGRTSVLFGYSLGKAQRLLHLLDPEIGTIYTHGAIEKMTEVLRPLVALPPTTHIQPDTPKSEVKGNLILAPPSTHGSTWLRKFAPFETASASGWMAFRGARRRRAIDRGFVLSDHCDWDQLLESIKATGAEKVICTHGYSDIFARYLNGQGWDARTVETQYEGESLDTSMEKESE